MSDIAQSSQRAVASRAIFCTHCVAESTDRTPGAISTTNGIGRKFYGNAMPCPECGSVIRTLWWCFIEAPVIPLGSYRYKTMEDERFTFLGTRQQFYSRRLPDLHWQQIWPTWAIGTVAAVLAVCAIIALGGRR
jgi:hypothetical protein